MLTDQLTNESTSILPGLSSDASPENEMLAAFGGGGDPMLPEPIIPSADSPNPIANQTGYEDLLLNPGASVAIAPPPEVVPNGADFFTGEPLERTQSNHSQLPGDVDGDGDLDLDDANAIIAALNTPASGPEDRRDLNGDGQINADDAIQPLLSMMANSDKTAPAINLNLANDTTHDGGSNTDGITADATIGGTIADTSQITKVVAGFNNAPVENMVDVTDALGADGSLRLNRALLERAAGGRLAEGPQSIGVVAKDQWGNAARVELPVVVDRNLYAFVNIGSEELGLINTQTDQIIQMPLSSLPGYPGGKPQHAWITPDQKTLYFSTDASPPTPATAFAIDLSGSQLDWERGTASLTVESVLELAPEGTPSAYPTPEQTDPRQPIAQWTQPPFTQAHGPTFQPGTDRTLITQWTDNNIRAISTETNTFLPSDPLNFGPESSQTHGINFNPAGTVALGTGYYYDLNEIDVYAIDPLTGDLGYRNQIRLSSENGDGAFTHYTVWVDNRYALTASMQFGPTSSTPAGQNIVGPSIWLLDTVEGTSERIIDTAESPNDDGIYRSPSDIGIAGNKLYVAEEDSLGDTFGRDGFISVFDISDVRNPQFIKRFQPGVELPADFAIAHGLSVTPDESHIYVASYASDYIIKIDTQTDEVVKVYSSEDGLDAPHGGYMAGQYR